MNSQDKILNIINQEPDPNFRWAWGYICSILSIIFFIEAFILKDDIMVTIAIFIGSILSILGILYLSIYKGYLFNFSKNRIKKYDTVLFLRFGSWKELLDVERIVLDEKFAKFSNQTVNFFQRPYKDSKHLRTFRICMCYKNSDRFNIIIHFRDKEQAIEKANLLAQYFNLMLENRLS